MQFLVTAYDGKDSAALDRRMVARKAHLAGVVELKKTGNFIEGGAILDSDGKMIGSTLYMEFPSRKEFDDWLAKDPYIIGGVWMDVKVQDIRLALRND